jgi:fatty-acyl-CoA synthase
MLSYACGAEVALREQTVDEALKQTASLWPDHEALVVAQQQKRFTYAQLDAEVERVARGIAGLGLRAGDRAGLWATNCAEWILVQLACARSGVILVNVNPAYRSHDLGYVLQKSRLSVLFLRGRDSRADYRAVLAEACENQKLQLAHTIYFGEKSWEELLASGTKTPEASIRPTDVVNIQYTSGTTGNPKGVLLTHRNVLNNAALGARLMGLRREDRVVNPFPLNHCGGCVMGSLAMVAAGFTLILPSSQFDATAVLSAVSRERATALFGVPTMFMAELECAEFTSFDLTSLRTGVMAGAPCANRLMRRVVTEMHIPEMLVMYGQTEASPVITMSRPEDDLEHRVSTVGCAMPNTEVKIVALDTGATLPLGERGELCARGYMVMKGYDDDSEATAHAIDADGWLHTGDCAVMNADGYFRMKGRAKDMIIRGGENIFPAEIENFLQTHPKIADAQVIGMPDEKLGEVVVAWIRLRAGAVSGPEEIREFCRGKIAHFKVPQHFRFVESFPMTATGKIQKYKIREIEAAQGIRKTM